MKFCQLNLLTSLALVHLRASYGTHNISHKLIPVTFFGQRLYEVCILSGILPIIGENFSDVSERRRWIWDELPLILILLNKDLTLADAWNNDKVEIPSRGIQCPLKLPASRLSLTFGSSYRSTTLSFTRCRSKIGTDPSLEFNARCCTSRKTSRFYGFGMLYGSRVVQRTRSASAAPVERVAPAQTKGNVWSLWLHTYICCTFGFYFSRLQKRTRFLLHSRTARDVLRCVLKPTLDNKKRLFS